MQTLCDGPKNRVRYEINGAHRGGRDHSRLLLDKLLASSEARMPEVILHDLLNERSQELAREFEGRGVAVTVHDEEVSVESKPEIEVYAIDDAKRDANAVNQPVRSQLLEVGLMVAATQVERLGGTIVGFGVTLPPNEEEAREKAYSLFSPIAELAQERRSSKNMSASLINSVQMDGTRHQVHDRLTDSSLDFLKRGTVSPDIFAVDGLTNGIFPLEVLETRRDTRRQDLKDLVTHEILPQMMEAEDRAGVAFYDRQDPWLYMVFARKSGAHWRTVNIVELPVQVLEPTVIPVGTLVEEKLRAPVTTWSETWVTD